ncbi:C4-dicarboxylate ABC transporter [Desulfosarcina widdelii]|uniref:C4-dicarboxylate ABC transporter n=1 Tax=Desulfosarcina widdelii TaxID=947919 RepID=A0A5K7ZJS2_9BACT|nr:TAXI family TRAP transporter solute-binding subunit [Desulfosarcina widdelii]BBO78504.1 C4-dicarboxylate ABC transporter [Desulfosarcina widdelii]
MKNRFYKVALFTTIVAVCLMSSGMAAAADSDVTLPKMMHWSCYDVGAGAYIQTSAIADGLLKKYGVKVRLMPTGSDTSRILAMKTKRVEMTFLGNGAYFASEGLYDFSTYEWGPQDLRCVIAPPATHCLYTTNTSGVKDIKDLKGRRVAWVIGSPSLNVKTTGYLAFGNLTWDDVEKVEFASFGASLNGLIEGSVDAIGGTTKGGIIKAAASPKGAHLLELYSDDNEGWARLKKHAPFLKAVKESKGIDIEENHPKGVAQQRFPMAITYADADADLIYNFLKAVHQSYDVYKNSHQNMPNWEIHLAGSTPADVPFHEGAVRYLKEIGVWTAEDQAWNDARLDHLKKVQAAWEEAVDKAQDQKIKSKDFPAFWVKERAKALGE